MKTVIPYDRGTSIVGTTEHGKSYFAKRTIFEAPQPAIYFNTINDNKDMQGFVKIDGGYDMVDIYNAIDKGLKLNFNPSLKKDEMQAELCYIIRRLLARENREFVFAIDEMHLFRDKNILSLFEEIAFMGRHKGVRPVWITQRPQMLPRACITQSQQHIFFNMNFEDSWLKSYGINADDLDNQIQGRKYYYCRWTPGGGLEDAKKLAV